MGGAINLQGGGQYQAPNVTGASQPAPSVSNAAARFNQRMDYEPTYDVGGFGGYGDYGGGYGGYGGYGNYGGGYGGGYGNVSTGGKGFQQQQYQPAPVLRPYVDTVSTGGKGFQGRPTPSQATAYAPMNIPQMSFARPAYYYPSVAGQMANLSANYGMGGLGAMGAYQPLIPRPAMAYQPQLGTQYGTQQYMPPPSQYRQQQPQQQQQSFDQNRLLSLLSGLFGFGSQQNQPFQSYQPPSQPTYSYNPPTNQPPFEPTPTPAPSPNPVPTSPFDQGPIDFGPLTNPQTSVREYPPPPEPFDRIPENETGNEPIAPGANTVTGPVESYASTMPISPEYPESFLEPDMGMDYRRFKELP
jgi:hypothetical protein